MYKKIFSHLGEYKKYAILTPVVMIGEVAMEILIPFVMTEMINVGIKGDGGISFTVKAGLLMIAMAIISLCFGALGGMTAARAGMGFGKNLRSALFGKVQDFSFANVDKFSTASLVTRLTTDVTNVQNTLMMLIRMAIRSPFMLVGATVMAIKISPKLSTVFFIAIPFLAIVLILIMTNAHPRFEKMLKKYDAMNSSVQENLIGIRVVKAFVRERHEKDKFKVSAEEVRSCQIMAEKLIILNSPAMQISMYSCIVAILWFGGNLVIKGSGLDVGDLSGFISYVTQILSSLMMLSFIFISIVISRASVTRISEVLDEEIDVKDEGALDEIKDGSIEFKNVNFSYSKNSSNLTLEGINLKINSGETIGVIGGTGSAKSSLVGLIPRLYDVLDGEVRVGGEDVRNYKIKTLRDGVSMVLQKNVLFSGT
ncbi:MAG: ABC transporter ATP-binding protein, partial [Clostridia bacterium]|nr:ABC transporter ATP-binding protein [Clostridia bacterium]